MGTRDPDTQMKEIPRENMLLLLLLMSSPLLLLELVVSPLAVMQFHPAEMQ